MSRRRGALWGWILLLAVTVGGLLLLMPDNEPAGSALSAKSRGWLAARRYLEARDVDVTLADVPLEQWPGSAGLWVLAFPWQRLPEEAETAALRVHLHRGGSVLYAYSGALARFPEEQILSELRLEERLLRDNPPLLPWKWWDHQREMWELAAGDGWGAAAAAPEVVVPALDAVPRAPARASVLYSRRTGSGEVPLVFSYGLHRGRVVALPAALLANGHLLSAGHADFLESLRRWLGDSWSFDEYHHGLVNAELAMASERSAFAWDLFMIHLVVFYLLGFTALVRRFGPAWREAAVVVGSTASFLRNLGALHRDMGHHQAAARLLAVRHRELDPSLPEIAVPEVTTDARLVKFGREIANGKGLKSSV